MHARRGTVTRKELQSDRFAQGLVAVAWHDLIMKAYLLVFWAKASYIG